MESEEKELTKAQARQDERRDRYAAHAGEQLRQAGECQFSLLPYEELARVAANWYDASAQAMLRANYTLIDNLVRQEARVAAEQGFELADLVELFRLCRQVAIEKDGWNEDQFGDLDAIIDEALAALRGQVAWDIPEGYNYLTGKSTADLEREKHEQEERAATAKAAEPRGERRTHKRNKLRMPIRVHGMLTEGPVEEITRTENVAKGGVYFLSQNPYFKGAHLQVMYPYWSTPGAINSEYPAEVVRVDEREGGRKGVAVKFLVSLGSQAL
ncbi:PilZ domain-containing protein [Acidobacteriia bacterium AH_259_A11_L15]|nr:PilZ domain-containing protein [Acidobacteriia bacterium AH_259_A11_L15]